MKIKRNVLAMKTKLNALRRLNKKIALKKNFFELDVDQNIHKRLENI